MRFCLITLGFVGLFGFLGFLPSASAAGFDLTYHYKHYIFTISAQQERNWMHDQEVWTYAGSPIIPSQSFRVDGDHVPPLPEGFKKKSVHAFDRNAIMETIDEAIGTELNRNAGSVTIGETATGVVTFDGIGFNGRNVDLAAAADVTLKAIADGVSDVMLPVTETMPAVTVTSEDLRKQGIREFVTIGESNLSRSPKNRRHNIATGLSKFQGHIIPQGSVFSFDKVLGPVNGTTGYLKELVIKGELTIPDYGGGLCQVSTTAYRGIWEYGFPIVKRINHSYMVSHYAPQGTDATVYPPNIDMKFLNDSAGALLMQTYEEGDLAYFIYYGTRDDRTAELFGPFVSNIKPPPPDKRQLTLDLPPGVQKKVGERVPGENVAWFRTLKKGGKQDTQGTYSIYEARPLYTLVGTDVIPAGETGATIPSVFLDE